MKDKHRYSSEYCRYKTAAACGLVQRLLNTLNHVLTAWQDHRFSKMELVILAKMIPN